MTRAGASRSWGRSGQLDEPQVQEEMDERARAHVSRVKTGQLSLITRLETVVRVIMSAVEATT